MADWKKYKELKFLVEAEGYIEKKGTKSGHKQFEHPVFHNKITILTCNIKKNIELSVRRQIKEAKERFSNENQ